MPNNAPEMPSRPGLYVGERPRAECMAWMDYADALEGRVSQLEALIVAVRDDAEKSNRPADELTPYGKGAAMQARHTLRLLDPEAFTSITQEGD